MTRLRNFDSAIIARVQDAYLWLYDRSGMYVATCMMVCIFTGMGALTISDGKMDWFRIFVVLLNFVVIIPNYLMQDKQKFIEFNLMAMMLHQSSFRFWFVHGWLYPICVIDLIMFHWAWAFNQVAVAVFMYLSCIMIREREPKDWITKHKLVTEGAS